MDRLADILVVLLQRFGRVALKDVGTFYVRSKSAVFGLHRDFILPPFEIIEFSEVYDKDFDLISLAGQLRITSSFSSDELQKMLHDLIGHINKHTESKLEGIGIIRKSGDGLVFESVDSFNGQFYGLEAQRIQTVPVTHARNQDTSIVHKINSDPLVYRKSSDKSNIRLFIWPIIVVLITLLVLGGRYISCNKDRTEINTPVMALEELPADESDSIKGEVVAQPDQPEENLTDSVVTDSLDGFSGECVIIVGSFSKKYNAQRMLRKVKKAGYTPYFENINGRVRVGMTFECEEEDLTDSMQSMRKKFAKDAWYLKPQIRIE